MAKRLLTPAYLQTMHRGLNLTFNKELASGGNNVKPLSSELCLDTSSDGADEEYDWLGDMPVLTEIQGEQTKRNLQSRQMIITNREFSCLIGIKRAMLERDKMNLFTPRLKQVASAARKWFERRLYLAMVTRGWSASYPDWTGGAYWGTNKPMGKDKKAATFSNAGTSALTAAAYEAAVQSIRERVDAQGEPMNLGEEGFILVCGPKLESTAKKILKAEFISDGTAGGITNVNANTAELRVWGYLQGTYDDYWFLFARDSARSPFIKQTEVPPASYMCTDPNDSYVIQHGEFLFQIYARGELGPGESLLGYANAV